LSQARPPLQKTIHETDRASAAVLSDYDYFDNLLKTLPDAYRVLGRQALNGDFFSFYLCDIALKVNGKGGQPVYIKIAGQSSGRCTPK
jgi:phospholipid/cholesterol/gamma-HCH transport system substrate-binding protein